MHTRAHYRPPAQVLKYTAVSAAVGESSTVCCHGSEAPMRQSVAGVDGSDGAKGERGAVGKAGTPGLDGKDGAAVAS